MITWSEISLILRRVLRWWWVIVLAVAAASSIAFYLSKQETRFYVAHTSLQIGNTLESTVPDPNQLSVGSTLARYYAELARREPILRPVQESLKLPFAWELISDRMLTTNIVPSANLLEISISDTNPERAAAIASVIGEHLIGFSPTAPEKIAAEQQAIEQQLGGSVTKIKDFQDKIAELKAQEQTATSASDLSEIRQKMSLLEASLEQEQTSYKGLLSYKSNSVVNSLSFFERAEPPKEPLPSQRKQIVGLAGLAGLMLALAAIYVLERIDNRVRGPRDIAERFEIENLGTIPNGPPLLVATHPFAQERLGAARDAQTNILLAATDRRTRVLMVTSPQPSEARSGFSIDLADLFGRAGHRVLLVDADFTESFLTRMLAQVGVAQSWTLMSGSDPAEVWSYLRPTPITNVALLPGPDRQGTPAMIPSLRWRELVDHLLPAADVIIFDGPAALSGPDAALLAPHVDGVILTLDPLVDNREDIQKSKLRLAHTASTQLLGAVTFVPSQHLPHGRRALQAPQDLASDAPSAPTTRKQPIVAFRFFGREFRVVLGQSARQKPPQIAPSVPKTPTPETPDSFAPQPVPTPPIITPVPATDGLDSTNDKALERAGNLLITD